MKFKFSQLLALIATLVFCTAIIAQDCQQNWLSTEGNKIVDANGEQVTLAGVNWFGFETDVGAPHGLWNSYRNMDGMLQQIKDLGFNCIRVPWANETMFGDLQIDIYEGEIDAYTNKGPQPSNESMANTPLELMDLMVEWCQENDMRIILDNHSRSNVNQAHLLESLWYLDGHTSHEQWIADWIFLAERYKDYPAVVGMDLNNEPHDSATWGSGDLSTDWRLAAEECGNAILEVNPNVLIVVEGIHKFTKNGVENNYWWGGNLMGAEDFPVRLNDTSKLVYSPHEYGPTVFAQDWFFTSDFPSNMEGIWEENFNFLNSSGTAPLLIGEFGIRDEGSLDEVWLAELVDFIKEQGLHYTYWCFNENSGDTGGILKDDWLTVEEWKMDFLAPILHEPIPNCLSSTNSSEVVIEEPEVPEEEPEVVVEVPEEEVETPEEEPEVVIEIPEDEVEASEEEEEIITDTEGEESVVEELFTAYPNPTTNSINFNSNLSSFEMFDLRGRYIKDFENISLQENVTTYDLTNVSTGIYMCRVQIENGDTVAVKIVKR